MKYCTFFTDGSVRRDLGVMSYAWIRVEDDDIVDVQIELNEGANSAEAEVNAVLIAMREIKKLYEQDPSKTYILVSDCEYCIKAINLWIDGWISQNRPVKFLEQWKEIHTLVKEIPVFFFWVRGHNGTFYNEMVDEFCKDGLKAYHEVIFNIRSDIRSN